MLLQDFVELNKGAFGFFLYTANVLVTEGGTLLLVDLHVTGVNSPFGTTVLSADNIGLFGLA